MSDGPASNLRARKTNGAASNGNGAAKAVNGNGKAANGTVLSYAIPTEYGQAMDRKLDTHQSYVFSPLRVLMAATSLVARLASVP